MFQLQRPAVREMNPLESCIFLCCCMPAISVLATGLLASIMGSIGGASMRAGAAIIGPKELDGWDGVYVGGLTALIHAGIRISIYLFVQCMDCLVSICREDERRVPQKKSYSEWCLETIFNLLVVFGSVYAADALIGDTDVYWESLGAYYLGGFIVTLPLLCCGCCCLGLSVLTDGVGADSHDLVESAALDALDVELMAGYARDQG